MAFCNFLSSGTPELDYRTLNIHFEMSMSFEKDVLEPPIILKCNFTISTEHVLRCVKKLVLFRREFSSKIPE